MKNIVMILGMAFILGMLGCEAVARTANQIAPSQTDVSGNVLVGTHQLTPIAQDATGAIPYATPVAAIILFAWNFFERVRANKNAKGLRATVQAIEAAGEDPATAAAIADLKVKLSHAHDVAGVQPLIRDILSKI